MSNNRSIKSWLDMIALPIASSHQHRTASDHPRQVFVISIEITSSYTWNQLVLVPQYFSFHCYVGKNVISFSSLFASKLLIDNWLWGMNTIWYYFDMMTDDEVTSTISQRKKEPIIKQTKRATSSVILKFYCKRYLKGGYHIVSCGTFTHSFQLTMRLWGTQMVQTWLNKINYNVKHSIISIITFEKK